MYVHIWSIVCLVTIFEERYRMPGECAKKGYKISIRAQESKPYSEKLALLVLHRLHRLW